MKTRAFFTPAAEINFIFVRLYDMEKSLIINSKQFDIIIRRLCYQLVEQHDDFSDSAIIGLQPRGIFLSKRIATTLAALKPGIKIAQGELDVTFFRDDFRRRDAPLVPSTTNIDFLIENKNVILVDDVLFSGRTIRSGMDALLAFGRPRRIELLTLIDRRYSRHLPIEPDYTGRQVDTIASEKVKVYWKETDGVDQVMLFTPEPTQQT